MDLLYQGLEDEVTFPDVFTRKRNGCLWNKKTIIAIGDCSEQPVYCTTDESNQAYLYSAKKKKHTVSTLVYVSPNGVPYFKSKSVGGSMLDLAVATMEESRSFLELLEPKEYLGFDAGFRGFQKYWPHSIFSEYPVKYNERTWHQWCSVRSVVENFFAHVKKWLICCNPLRTKNLDEALFLHNRAWTICVALVKLFESPIKRF
jgi:hypothetical protein